MKITFLSLGVSTDAIGPRILSSLLKKNGFDTQIIFLPTKEDIARRATKKAYFYRDNIIDQIVSVSRKSDLIGISLMTHHVTTAIDLTRKLKEKLAAPVIWGGIHPTVCPEECLEVADIVCVGEAENSLTELCRRIQAEEDITDIQGIWGKQDGRVADNGYGPLVMDLDSLPFPDYSFEDHHLLVGDELQIMNEENWHKHLLDFFPSLNKIPDKSAYQVLSARGCPFKCTFCGESPLVQKAGYGKTYFRRRSIDNLLDELTWAKQTFSCIGEICFCDDTFPSRSLEELVDFTEKYKNRIGLPFYILVSPVNVTKQKIDHLVDAGLTNIGMGIQSGSKRIIELYNRQRVGSVELSLQAARILNDFKDRLLPYYDFIIENPYETKEDYIDTLKLISRLPRPFEVRVYALSFFPGTELRERAYADGMLHADSFDKTFGQRSQGGYLSFLIDLSKRDFIRPVLKILVSKPFVFVFCRPFFDGLFISFHNMLKWLAVKLKIHNWGLS